MWTSLLLCLAVAQVPLHRHDGQSAEDWFGYAVISIGDANGDGVADYAVGAPFADVTLLDEGEVSVFSGADHSLLLRLQGENPGDAFGWSLAAPGDVDGDGNADVLVGIPFHDGAGLNAGQAAVFSVQSGLAIFEFFGEDLNDQFGFAVASGGDSNGDGNQDFLIGAPHGGRENGGYVRIHSGLDGTELGVLSGDLEDDEFGYSLAFIGDADIDGKDDFVIGARLAKDGLGFALGSARVFSGDQGLPMFTARGAAENVQFGSSVAAVGDLNGDGVGDVLVGAPLDSDHRFQNGSAWIFSGVDGQILAIFRGDEAGDRLGYSVAAVGEIDQDGVPDFMIGLRNAGWNGLEAGLVRVYSGLSGNPLYSLNGSGPNAWLGSALASAGDLDGDGFPELLLGANRDDAGGNGPAGSVSVLATWKLQLQTPVLSHSGTVLTLTVTGASPLQPVFFLQGLQKGVRSLAFAGWSHQVCDLMNPALGGVDLADSGGEAILSQWITVPLIGVTAYFQSVDSASGWFSNLREHTF
ncbi:MAG: hypothetical protein DWQ01_12200 [Planctomycetota bacterium]|nr:MAG: hypothetical protein DWQ01_12200 [Planctomycetota bacterium]